MDTIVKAKEDIAYPSYNDEPMAENTIQNDLLILLKDNLKVLYLDREDVFIACDLLWYPVEGKPKINTAPDVMVVFGRPKGDRKSYIQHQEEGIAPQVVFEIVSESNREKPMEMLKKLNFYSLYGVQEYYIYDPETNDLQIYLRTEQSLQMLHPLELPFVSPMMGIRFELTEKDWLIYFPDGRKFETVEEREERIYQTEQKANQAEQKANQAEQKANQAEQKANQAEQKTNQAEQKTKEIALELQKEKESKEKLIQKLKELGIDPEKI